MKRVREFYGSLNDARLVLFLVAVLVIVVVAGVRYFRTPKLMFVQSAEDLKVDSTANTFRLVKVNQLTVFFSDRPVRIAGHYRMAEYLKRWSQGRDNFGKDHPNATLSVYEPGRAAQTLVVVEIDNPVVDGADLIYSYRLLNGAMPASGGATALFIDWAAAVGRPGFGVGGVGGPGVGGPAGVGW